VLTATRKQLEKSKKQKAAAAAAAGSAPTAAGASGGASSAAPKATVVMEQIAETLPVKGAELVNKMKGVIQWNIDGEKWLLDLKNGSGSIAKGEGPADLTVTMSDDVFFQVSQGKISAQQAFMKKLIAIKGNMGMATKLGPILTAAKPQARL
jgi:(3R)-3-hydroxyacyl-CoA dehydrogenase / 3a,7a,12a-trihydroxy-5b-cholest-24-enoyl-CoA hydratase / enoyl-CoA hydratase 2